MSPRVAGLRRWWPFREQDENSIADSDEGDAVPNLPSAFNDGASGGRQPRSVLFLGGTEGDTVGASIGTWYARLLVTKEVSLKMEGPWFCYLLECADGTLYAGITTNLDRRVGEHNRGTASKYTRARLPVRLVYAESQLDRAAASRREREIKRMGRAGKLELAATHR